MALLLAATPMANLEAAVDLTPNEYLETAKDYGLKGPVRTYGYQIGPKSISLAFSKDGILTQGKAMSHEGTASTYHTVFDRAGRIVRKTHTDYSLKNIDSATCATAERIKREINEDRNKHTGDPEKQPSGQWEKVCEKCTNNSNFAKNQILNCTSYHYNDKGELIKKVEIMESRNYRPHVTEYRYENGLKTGERAYDDTTSAVVQSTYWPYTWAYDNGLLVKDNNYVYKYNDKQQLIEKCYKGDANNKFAFTYHPNGKLKSRIYGNRQDTLICNNNGDTLLITARNYWQYHRPDGRVEPQIGTISTSRQTFEYNKKNIRTSHKIYDENNAIAFEDIFDKDGNCVKSVFDNGHIERTFDKKEGTVTKKLYIDDKLTDVAVFNDFGVCVKEEVYKKDGTISETYARQTDQYGNVVRYEEMRKNKTRVVTYTITYY